MQSGMLRKLFLLRSNFFNEIKEQIPSGIAPSISLQSLRFKFVKKLKYGKEGKCKPIPSELFLCNNQNEKSELSEVGAIVLHPDRSMLRGFSKAQLSQVAVLYQFHLHGAALDLAGSQGSLAICLAVNNLRQ